MKSFVFKSGLCTRSSITSFTHLKSAALLCLPSHHSSAMLSKPNCLIYGDLKPHHESYRIIWVKITVLFLLITLYNNSFSQLIQPNRFEIPLGDNEEPYNVLKGDKEQLLLFRRIFNIDTKEGQLWEVLQLDTMFQMMWKQTYVIDNKFTFVKYHYHKEQLHLLFTNSSGNKTDLELITVNTAVGKGVHHHIENFIPFNLTEFKSSKYGVLIGGYYNYRPLVLYYNFESKKTKVLPGFYHEKSELIQLKVNEDETVDIILSGTFYGNRKKKILEIKTFDYEGNILRNTLLDNIDDKNLLYGRSCGWNKETKFIAGTYGKRNSEYSRGVFLANINQYGEHKVNFYNYGDLKNFFSYMRAKREKRVRSRIERRKINHKKIKFNYRLLVHDVFQKGDQYIMLGEAFYPKYIHSTVASASGIFQQIGRSGSESIFDGYRYTHAVVLGFNSKGKLLWDNSFEITDVKTFEREQFVKVNVEEDRIVLLYVYDNVIRSKIIKENEVLEGKTFDELKLKFDNDVVTKTNNNHTVGLEKWYGNTFFAYGVQNIKNTIASGLKIERKVFFLNKIVYQ